MSKAETLAHRLDFEYADNGAGYNTEWTRGLQEAAALLRQQDEAIKLAHEVLDADESKIIRNAKDGYPEGRAARELTLAERVKALCIYAADWKRWCLEREAQQERKDEVIKLALEALEQSMKYIEGSANAKLVEGWGEQLDANEAVIKFLREVQG